MDGSASLKQKSSAWRRHKTAEMADSAFRAGAGSSAAARSQCAAASLSSAAERGPASQAPHCPISTSARIPLACTNGASESQMGDSVASATTALALGKKGGTPRRVRRHLLDDV